MVTLDSENATRNDRGMSRIQSAAIELGRRLGKVKMNRVRWFEAFLIFYVAGWLFVIWAAGDPPRFFL